nr:PREDICTED: junctional adhesion molecule A isoform X1 [Struthio camelus australis]
MGHVSGTSHHNRRELVLGTPLSCTACPEVCSEMAAFASNRLCRGPTRHQPSCHLLCGPWCCHGQRLTPGNILSQRDRAPYIAPAASGTGPLRGSLVGAQITSETKEVPENQSADIPCSAYRSKWNNPRIEWKFQKGSSLVLFYYGGQLTEPYKTRVQFSPTMIHFTTVTRADTGKYICEVVGENSEIAKSEVNLIVQVPPSKPVAHVPTSATIGSKALLRCTETDGSPPPTFQWYKNSMLMPADPKTSLTFRNSSYTIDSTTGVLTFEPVSSFDTGDYYCEASNNVGSSQRSEAIHMEASEVNVGGIVAAVVVLLMVLALVAFGIWFAYTRGFFSKRRDTAGKKVIYSQPSHRSEGEFKQTSSFLV